MNFTSVRHFALRGGIRKLLIPNQYGRGRNFTVGRCSVMKIRLFQNAKAISIMTVAPISSVRQPSSFQNIEKDLSLEGISTQKEDVVVPDPPAVPPTTDSVQQLQESFHELGLGSYFTPSGWIQNLMDVLHSSTGLPWWEVIVLSTIMIRACTLPVIISAQRTGAVMMESQPEMEKIARKLEAAKRSGDQFQFQLAVMEMQKFLVEKRLPMMKRMMYPMIANGAIFTCYFFALRGMASAALPSMKTEGLLWFTDLTAADPMMILPTMCAMTTFLIIELGIEMGMKTSQMDSNVRWILRIAPFAILVFGSKLPAAIMCYWLTSNLISLILALVLRIAVVRRVLKIPPLPPRKKVPLRESWRLPQFLRDYLSAPVYMMRAAREKLRKGRSNSTKPDKDGSSEKKSR